MGTLARRRCSVALLALALVPAGAQALPGDPPITPASPADGATVPANAEGISVSYSCPAYRQQVYGSPEDPITERGDAGDYDVRFSDSPALGADGLLASKPYGSDASAQLASDGSCTSVLDTADSSSSPEVAGGRVFWQAYRSCIGCERQRPETASVRSFVVRSSVTGKLKVPRRSYGGYLGIFALESEAKLSGAKVALQRRTRGRWKTVVTESYRLDRTELIASLPAGRQKVRALVIAGTRKLAVATRTLTVRRPGRRSTSRRDNGRYAARRASANSTLSFKVTGGGSTLRNFRASVTTFCFGPTLPDNRLALAFAVLDKVRVAPDGSVVGLLKTRKGAREVLHGRLRNGRFVGEVSVAFSTCSGTRKLDAVRR